MNWFGSTEPVRFWDVFYEQSDCRVMVATGVRATSAEEAVQICIQQACEVGFSLTEYSLQAKEHQQLPGTERK